jgi:hypothetical protein
MINVSPVHAIALLNVCGQKSFMPINMISNVRNVLRYRRQRSVVEPVTVCLGDSRTIWAEEHVEGHGKVRAATGRGVKCVRARDFYIGAGGGIAAPVISISLFQIGSVRANDNLSWITRKVG